ncbi:MAG: FMN-binding negative transcriptional regulator [Pseudomonadota bacterium]
MHPNATFRREPEARSRAFAAERGFGVLCVSADPTPLLAHVPFRLEGDAADLHLMRSNPLARALAGGPQPAVLAVSGPDAYISPDWYGVEDQVPTWNYVAVHLSGQLSLRPDTTLRPLLDRLSEHFETQLTPKPPWTTDKMSPGTMERMMRMLVSCRLSIDRVESTWKLGQNKAPAARDGAARGIDDAAIGQDPRLVAALMRGLPEGP